MANRSNNAYRRMTGRLRLNGHSAILETLEGGLFYLVTPDNLGGFDDRPVVVEGELSGQNRLLLTWIGIAGD